MEDNKFNSILDKNEYLFKTLYLIRKNLPKTEFIYLLMFFFKYIGLILFSISLNVFDTNNNSNQNQNEPKDLDGDMGPPSELFFGSDGPKPEDNERFRQNNNSNNSNNNLIQTIFRKLLINGDSFQILKNSYQIICIIGFIILIVYILLWIFGIFYMKKKYYNKVPISITDRKIKEINQSSKTEKRYFRILTYFLFLIVFFHQYIIEYYNFGFLGYIFNLLGVLKTSEGPNNNDNYTSYITDHLNNITLPQILIIFINLVTIIIILIIFVLFLLINSTKTLYINDNYPLYSDQKNLIINFILLNLNPLYGLMNCFQDETQLKIAIVFVIIIILLILIKITITYYYFSPLPYKLNYLCIFIEFFCLFGCITNLITYLTKSEINSTKFSIIKAIFELINGFLFSAILIKQKNKRSMKIFSDNLFSTNFKTLNPSGIYYYIKNYIEYSHKLNNYMIVFRPIQNHVLNCSNKDCPGHLLLPKSLSYSIFTDFKYYSKNNNIPKEIKEEKETKIKESTIIIKGEVDLKNSVDIKKPILKSLKSKDNIKLKNSKMRRKSNLELNNDKEEEIINNYTKKFLSDSEFKMIGEQEIINRINFLYRRKKYDYLQKYIFIHLQYIIKVKQNYRLALYYLGKYFLSEIKFSFLSKYCLYEIKSFICESIFSKQLTNTIQDPYIKKYKEENIKLGQLMDYISLFNIVKKILKTSCESIIQFYSFRRELHNTLSLQKYTKTKIYPIFQSSEKIKTSIFNLQFLLDKLNKEKKHSLESVELSYLICNFFELINGRIPQDILSNVKPILYFRESLYEQLINEFRLFMMNNPLIISLTQKDTFNIIYFTNIFLKKLGFSFYDLKDRDFHEKLFPGNQDLIKEHSLILKQFLFFYNNTYSKFNTFVKSKEGYLVSVNFNCKVFPSFINDFLLIANIIFNNELNGENMNNTIESSKNDKKIIDNNQITNTYSFMLNNNYEIFSLTKNFYIEYNLNQAMFRELRINFCQFFCIDEDKLSKQIYKERKKILQENPHLNNQISLKESNKAYTIFQNITMKNLFKIREEKILETYNYPDMSIYEKIDKKKLIRKIPDIINIIDEIGLDYDWYIRLQKYKDRLTNNNTETGLTFNTFSSEQYFEVIFSIKKLGSILYYVVNLNEIFNKENENKDSPKYKNKKSIININNKTFKKLGTKASKSSMKSFDNKNRKSVSSSSFASNSILKAMNENINKDENNKNLAIAVINPSTNNKIINFKLDKKKEKEKHNDKDNLQSKKTQKNSLYDNSEYLKNLNKRKKQFLEDDENTPLISRDKFNNIISQKEKKNKIFIFIIYIFIIMSLCLIIAKTIQNLTAVDENIKVLALTINLEQLKVDIYLESILILHYCVSKEKTGIIIETPFIQMSKLNELMSHLNQVQEYINTILNNKHSFSIFKVIEERFDIMTMGDDWEVTSRTVDLLEETRRLSYIIGGAVNSEDETCEYEMINQFYWDFDTFKKNKHKPPSNRQKLFFYFNSNILSNYKMTFEKLSEVCASSLEKMWNEYQNIQLVIISIVCAIMIAFIIIFCIKFCLDNSFYQLLFLYYYKIENYQKKFETKIYYLYKTVLEFNYDNIKYFEFIKLNEDATDLSALANKKSTFNIINNLNGTSKSNSNNNKDEQNSMNSSLLNSSMNGSSIQFLNKSNHQLNLNNKIENINNTPFDSKIEENEENKVSQEETIDSLMKFVLNILPNSHRFSLIFILINSIIYLGICGINIYEIYDQLYRYKFSINLAMNVLERVPRIMELVLYPSITILLNDTDLIKPVDHQSPYLEFFVIDSLYYSQELIDTFFKNSLYGQILKDNLKLKYNLENYLFDNKYSLFKKVQYWERKLNIIGEFCINMPLGQIIGGEETEIIGVYSNLYEIMEALNNHSIICKTNYPGMKDSGIKIEFNFILQEITTRYLEFVSLNKSTQENLKIAIDNFIKSDGFEKALSDLKMYLLFYFNIISYNIKQDFNEQNNEMTNAQIIYSVLFLIINIEIIISLIIIMTKEEKYKKLFGFFATIPKDEVIKI